MDKKDLIKALEVLDNDYRLVGLRDCCDEDTILGVVYLNKKHSIDDFQKAIYKAKEKREDEIYEFGEDWTIITEELDDFDYIETSANLYEDSVEF